MHTVCLQRSQTNTGLRGFIATLCFNKKKTVVKNVFCHVNTELMFQCLSGASREKLAYTDLSLLHLSFPVSHKRKADPER